MVTFNKPIDYRLSSESIKIEQERFQDLMAQDLLVQVNINRAMTCFWLIFKVNSEEAMNEVIKTLPACRNFEQEIHELIWN